MSDDNNLVPMPGDLFGVGDRCSPYTFALCGAAKQGIPETRASILRFLQGLRIPEGPNAGKRMKLAPFQKSFIKGTFARGVSVSVLSIGRGNAKSALSAGVALGALVGVLDPQPRREIVIAARTRDQARIAFDFAAAFARTLPVEIQGRMIFRRSPRLEIEFEGDGGGHFLRAIAADARNALGTAPNLVLMDERGHWPADRGDELEDSLMSGLGKRGGRAIIISTSAPDDAHPFSRWIDQPPPGTFVQEHRPSPGLPADDLDSLLIANPGAKHGIGSSPTWLQSQAERAIAMGGHALTAFRLYNRNERISGEARDLLLTVDEWLSAEAAEPPHRSGPVVIGIDLGGSASMTAAAFYWPETFRLEVYGTFPARPSLRDRGNADGVAARYCEMEDRGELATLGDKTVPVAAWLESVMRRVSGETISAMVADRYKMAELGEAMQAAGVRCPVIWRGQGYRDSSEDCDRFRRAVFDGKVKCAPSLLMRSALSDAVVLRDPAGNMKLAKGRSTGRIDAASAAVLALAEGARQAARPMANARSPVWI